MPTTTNFGWTTPADTDLVKDGAAAIRTLGNGIDTSLLDLKGGTTGQILSKASNTDLDYTWINNDQGDLTGLTAGVGITITSETGPVPTITNSSTDLITTAGDILYGTAADTVARLGIGTAGQVLTVNSGATAPEWAAPVTGGMTLLNAGGTTLTGASVSITSIAGTYNYLQIFVRNYKPATDGSSFTVRFNNDTGTSYRAGSATGFSGAANLTAITTDGGSDNGTANGLITFQVFDYANSATYKMLNGVSIVSNATNPTTDIDARYFVGAWFSSAAITRLDFQPASGNFTSGTVYVYGVK